MSACLNLIRVSYRLRLLSIMTVPVRHYPSFQLEDELIVQGQRCHVGTPVLPPRETSKSDIRLGQNLNQNKGVD